MTGPAPGPGADPVAPHPPRPPVDPPAPDPPDPPNPTPGGGATTPVSSPEPGGPGAGPDAGPGDTGVIPSGWELLENALGGAADSLAEGVASLVDMFHIHFLTLPAAGKPADPATWVLPSDPNWQAALGIYTLLSVFVLPLVWAIGWFNVSYPRGMKRRQRLMSFVTAFVLILAGWTILQGWLHFWNEAALAFAPSGEDFMATPGNATKLGVGAILGVILVLLKAIIVLAGLILQVGYVFLTFAFVALWPLSVALYASDVFAVDALGTAGLFATLLLAPLKFVTALLLALIFRFPLDPASPATASTFLFVIVGVALAFVVIPYVGLKYLLPRSIVAAGHTARQRGGEEATHLRERAPSADALRERVTAVSVPTSRLSRNGTGSGDRRSAERTRPVRSTTYQNSQFRADADTRTRTQD